MVPFPETRSNLNESGAAKDVLTNREMSKSATVILDAQEPLRDGKLGNMEEPPNELIEIGLRNQIEKNCINQGMGK
jgi:hypothetical protein